MGMRQLSRGPKSKLTSRVQDTSCNPWFNLELTAFQYSSGKKSGQNICLVANFNIPSSWMANTGRCRQYTVVLRITKVPECCIQSLYTSSCQAIYWWSSSVWKIFWTAYRNLIKTLGKQLYNYPGVLIFWCTFKNHRKLLKSRSCLGQHSKHSQ
jgi:hypothetical protein